MRTRRRLTFDRVSLMVVFLGIPVALYLAFVVVVVLGTLVIFTFDPCPVINGVPHVADYCPAP